MANALIVVDVQNDFLPNGELGVDRSYEIIGNIVSLAEQYDFVAASQDWHPHDHISFKQQGGPWPAHCVKNTDGAELDYQIAPIANVVARKGEKKDVEEYSAFQVEVKSMGTLGLVIQDNFEAVDIVGLALDYCVRNTAIDFALNGTETRVFLDLTRPVDYYTGMQAVTDMVDSGVNVAVSENYFV